MRLLVLAAVTILFFGAYFAVGRRPLESSISPHAEPSERPKEAPKPGGAAAAQTIRHIPAVRQARNQVGVPLSSLGRLPISLDEVPQSEALEKGFEQLSHEYGPMYTTILDSSLARRAQLATCGIREEGAVNIEIRSSADADTSGRTMTANSVRVVRSSFSGDAADRVTSCVRGAVLHETREAAIDGPDGRKMDPNESVEFDFVDFPIEQDEIYDFLRTGSLDSFHYRATKKKYGF